jgi:hypothetical protein
LDERVCISPIPVQRTNIAVTAPNAGRRAGQEGIRCSAPPGSTGRNASKADAGRRQPGAGPARFAVENLVPD